MDEMAEKDGKGSNYNYTDGPAQMNLPEASS